MKFGSSRWGNDFETKVREFIVKYGFEVIAENITITCQDPKHKKKSHEIDLIASFTFPGHALPPIYGPGMKQKFIVSAKGGIQSSEDDIKDVENQLECLRKNPSYADVEKATIICEHSSSSYPKPPIYLWDEKFMHLLSMKLRIFNMIHGTSIFSHGNDTKTKTSLMFQVFNTTSTLDGKPEQKMTIYIFKEDPEEPIGKSDILNLTSIMDGYAEMKSLSKIINVYSPAGFKSDLLMLRGKIMPENNTLYINSLSDLSIATWVPILDNDLLF